MTVNKTVCLGDEYDDELWRALRSVLEKLGASNKVQWSGIGGSQEIDHFLVTVRGQEVTVESETFVGITISGPESLINEIEKLTTQAKRDAESCVD